MAQPHQNPPRLFPELDPPLLNSSSVWATTREDLRALYQCEHTGAVTTRTSLIIGFPHDDSIHRYCFFSAGAAAEEQPTAAAVLAPESVSSSLNTLGYSPIPIADYIEMIQSIEQEMVRLYGQQKLKPVIFSVTGSPREISMCWRFIATMEHYARQFRSRSRWLVEVNLSCPNIPGRPPPAYSLEALEPYLSALQTSLRSFGKEGPLVGIKTPPYTFQGQFDGLIGALKKYSPAVKGGRDCPIAFITATNTLGSCLAPSSADEETGVGIGIGGLAGASLHPLALGNVSTLRRMLDAEPELRHIAVIGVGGVADAAGYARMRGVGATAVGLATALGVQGVNVFRRILSPDGAGKE